jgi:hypothetical protein
MRCVRVLAQTDRPAICVKDEPGHMGTQSQRKTLDKQPPTPPPPLPEDPTKQETLRTKLRGVQSMRVVGIRAHAAHRGVQRAVVCMPWLSAVVRVLEWRSRKGTRAALRLADRCDSGGRYYPWRRGGRNRQLVVHARALD